MAVMVIITLFVLFGDDIRLVGLKKKSDDIFFGISTFALCFFMMEILLSSIAIPRYFNGFYFWLDLISTVSIIFDIGWVWDVIVGTEDFSSGNSQQISLIARAGRGARVGTRAARIVRIISLFRLIRILKLLKIQERKSSVFDDETIQTER